MNYYISDLHFGHANAIKFDARPFGDVEEMDRVMIERWNETVCDDDVVYIVGDFCYRSGRSAAWYLSQLKGHKHLVVGNHDWLTLKDTKAMSMFASVNNLLEVDDGERHAVLCHYPMAEWRNSRRTAWHIYGHIHTSRNRIYEFMRTLDRALNAGAPVNGYRPSTFDELMENNRRFNAAAGMSDSITEECT